MTVHLHPALQVDQRRLWSCKRRCKWRLWSRSWIPLSNRVDNGSSRHLSEKLDTSSRTEAILEEERLKVGTWRPSSVITLQGMRLNEEGVSGCRPPSSSMSLRVFPARAPDDRQTIKDQS
ncbi:hypothetical protein NPIL_666631 [Nephila pilipes]|uniref:Uncharacterized protein n=1 Tax=Nephila pilipes TaxID=299642 RepID=A0A8X6NJH6_NEPPI|nr:hypothetical protein NPIL_666631 [Nephila pilipes]